jgi:putative MATE family efflux protein
MNMSPVANANRVFYFQYFLVMVQYIKQGVLGFSYSKLFNLQYLKNIFREIGLALKGSEQDYTNVSLKKSIFLLAVPMVLEMMMESIFAIVDIFFVSKLGSDAVATVGLTESMMTIVYAIGFGLSAGTTAIVARRIGEKNSKGAAVAASQAIIAGVVMSMILAFPGIYYAKDLLRFMGASPSLIEANYQFTQIMISGNVVILLLFIINAAFRSAGDAAIAMRVLWYANIINIVLDPCLIFGLGPFPELGVKGAAIATTTGRGLAVIYQLYLLFSGKRAIKLKLAHLFVQWKVLAQIIRLSLGGILQNIIATSSWVFMVRTISIFGSDVIAGYTIAIRILIFSLLPSWGLSNAASTLVGQNLGAKKPDRAEKAIYITSMVNMLVMGVIGLFLVFVPQFFVRIFTSDVDVMHYAAEALRMVSYGCIFYGLGMVMVQSINGAGDTYTPTWINVFCFWMLEIPLAYYLAVHGGFAEKGVYIAIVIAESMLAMIGFTIIKKGNWKLKQV